MPIFNKLIFQLLNFFRVEICLSEVINTVQAALTACCAEFVHLCAKMGMWAFAVQKRELR